MSWRALGRLRLRLGSLGVDLLPELSWGGVCHCRGLMLLWHMLHRIVRQSLL